MAIRVAQIGTGNVGRHALTGILANPQFELTALWVSSDAKAGRDAAELAGLEKPTGVIATNDLAKVIDTQPDCAVYTALADIRLPDALEDYRRLLEAGINVVGSGPVFLQWPWDVIPDELIAPLEQAAKQGNSSLFVNGIDPGFANDLLPMALAGTCQRIEQVRCMEIVDYATYDSAAVMFDIMGFGKPMDEIPILLQPGVLSMAWGSVVRQLAAGLGITLLPGNVVPPAFDGVLRRPDPPVQRMLSAYTRVRPDPITAAFVEAICHHTLATPTHILSLLEIKRDH